MVVGTIQDEPATPTLVARESLAQREDEGVVVVDATRCVRYVDRTATALLAGRLELDEPLARLLLEDGPVEVPASASQPGIQLRARPATVDGEDGWLVTVADVTGRRTPEQRAVDLLGTAAHEIRTPIAAICGYAATLRTHGDLLSRDQCAEFLEVIERQAGRLGRMTSDLLAVSAASSGEREVRPERVVLGDAVREVVGLLGEGGAGVSLTGDLAVAVTVDPIHLQEIVTNLIVNASKYGLPPIVIDVTASGGNGVIAITDDGPGVPEGFVPRMWQPFARARASERPPDADGVGLGLPLVRLLAEANGGAVEYQPAVPNGSCFTVSVPLAAG